MNLLQVAKTFALRGLRLRGYFLERRGQGVNQYSQNGVELRFVYPHAFHSLSLHTPHTTAT